MDEPKGFSSMKRNPRESAAASPSSHHDSCWSKGGGGGGSQSSDQELALLRAIDAMALSTLSMDKDLGPVWFMGKEAYEWEFNCFPMFGKSRHGKWLPST
ncbi:hypothetical protein L3X38_023107 [Prunus dulcis]|uniref:Uncharacterized protein n=1 Tax=Prunus dulcis TaxID=3755 RepID=A0AAD4Z5T7_PRUDU|nr:hypothetical protein L3X38_023107 [Prunus dulcis]